MPDVREVLERAAAQPHDGPDTTAILRRARGLDRRRKAVWVAAPLLVLLAVLVLAPGLSPRPSVLLGPGAGDRDAFDLPARGEAAPEVLGDGTPVFVAHTEAGEVRVVEAFVEQGPGGFGQLVAWCPGAEWFEEPRYGSRFTPAGDWVGGPAPTGLATYRAEVDGSLVVVGERREPAPRGNAEFTPRGASCEQRWDDLVRHPQPQAAQPPEDAAGRHGTWAVVVGTVIHSEGDMPRICSAVSGNPPRCPDDAPVAHGVEPRDDDLRWWAATGHFLTQFRSDGLDRIVMFHDVEVEQGYKASEERRFGYIRSVDREVGGRVALLFEPAEWIVDPSAPNDYRIEVSEDPSMVLRLGERVEILGDIRLTGGEPGLEPVRLDSLLNAEDLATIPFWVTYVPGSFEVVRIEEQYVP